MSGRRIEDAYALSPMQQGLLFESLYAPGSGVYMVQLTLGFEDLDENALLSAWDEVQARNAVLRTAFAWKNLEEPVQIVGKSATIPVERLDWREMSHEERDRRFAEYVARDRRRGFDLSRAPLMRLALIRVSETEHFCHWSFHHILLDGWSTAIVLREVLTLYLARQNGVSLELAPPFAYKRYVEWVEGQDPGAAAAFWRDKLQGFERATPLGIDSRRMNEEEERRDESRSSTLSPESMNALTAFARRHGVTLGTVVQGAWALLLSRYSGEDDVVFGSAVSGREADLEGIENAVGLLMNTLPVRVRASSSSSDRSVVSWLRELQEQLVEMRDFEASRLVDVQRASAVPRGEPLFESILGFENYPVGNAADGSVGAESGSGSGRGSIRKVHYADNTHYPLALMVNPTVGLRIRVSFDQRRFHVDAMDRLLGHLETILAGFIARPEGELSDVPWLTEAERRDVLSKSAGPSHSLDDVCIHEWFQERAASRPDSVAVVSGSESVTYGELDLRAQRLAEHLRSLGVGPEVLVAIALERSVSMIVSALGVLEAGGAYVSIDATMPRERVAAMLRGAGVDLLLTSRRWAEGFHEPGVRIVRVDVEEDVSPPRGADGRRAVPSGGDPNPDRLAYVIFTSGSTGQPKGVALSHRGLVNLVSWHRASYDVTERDRATQLAGLGFDASVWEMWPYLASGASLHLPDDDTRLLAADLLEWMVSEAITTSFLPTALAEAVLEEEMPPGLALRALLTGGDKLHRGPRADLPFRLFNHYGPTEGSVVTTGCELEGARERVVEPPPPIGRPIWNTDAFVLDRELRPVPDLVPGELVIAGVGLARGYISSPDLTAEKFVPNPFSSVPGGRMYRTGDVVRRLPDGNLEFLGRRDHQVKLRGARIELGEVESVLAEHPEVRDAVVVLREDRAGSSRLVGYVVPRERVAADSEEAASLETERVARWQRTYDEVVYAEMKGDNESGEPTFNTRGWDSTFTGLPIEAEGMREQVEQTVSRVLALGPERVLEIGAGTGMLLFQLAPHVRRYLATDFSGAALDHVAKHLDVLGEQRSAVELSNRNAHDFDGIEPSSFDLVLMNSVVQYFPGVDYLLEVLDGALGAVRDGGHVVVGDVRHLGLLEAFHTEVELHHLSGLQASAGMTERVKERAAREQELLLSPELFAAFAQRNPRVSRISIRPKRGRHGNELARFRYDVVLERGSGKGEKAPGARELEWGTEVQSLSDVEALLRSERPERLTVQSVPNRRVLAGVEALRALESGSAPRTVAELAEWAERRAQENGVDPETAWGLAAEAYRVELDWQRSARGDGSFDILLVRSDVAPSGDGPTPLWSPSVAPVAFGSWRELASNPLVGSAKRGLAVRLREFLGARLPESMVPSELVLLEALPLNRSGKVDRSALPAPESDRAGLDGHYIAPRGPVEEGLASIWKDLLKLERVGAHDDFFELGGHSLLATQLVTRVRDAFQVDLPLRSLFESPTVAGLAERIAEAGGADADAHAPPLVAVTRSGPVELSFAQSRLWFLHQLDPKSNAYNVHAAIRMRGALDTNALGESLDAMVRRHESLRTRFVKIDGRPFQRIDDGAGLVLRTEDLSAAADPEAEARRRAAEEAAEPFDLSRGPLFRTLLLRLSEGDDDHALVLTLHHIVSDGWSIGIFFREWGLLYEAETANKPSPLAALPIQYADFARWQRSWLSGDVLEAQLGYWKRKLDGVAALELPTDHPRPATRTYDGARESFVLSRETTNAVRELSQLEGMTLFMTLLAAFVALLHRYTDQEDIAVGTPIAGRNRREIEGLIGFFVNTLVLRCDLSGGPSFRELLGRVRETALGAYAHQDLPFEKLVEEMRPDRDLGQNPLFQTVFAFQNVPFEGFGLEGLTLSALEVEPRTARFDLEMHVWERLDGLRVAVSYNRNLYEEETVRRFLGHFRSFLESAVSSPKRPVSELMLLSDEEMRRLLVEWNGRVRDYPRDLPPHVIFEQQAARAPGRVAVASGEQSLTYAELNRRANRMARRLRSLGVGPDTIVGLESARSTHMVVGLLGIAKAGGAYLPLDASYPAERRELMLRDTGATTVVTDRDPDRDAAVPEGSRQDVSLFEDLSRFEDTDLEPVAGPDNLAYVIFTSGSTGVAKGVAVPNRAVNRLVLDSDYVELTSEDVVAQASTTAFDAATFELWGPLLSGGRVEILTRDEVLSRNIGSVLEERAVTVLFLTTALFNRLVKEDPCCFRSLRTLLFGGEAVDPEVVRSVLSSGPPKRLLHVYGPTENTTFSTWHEVTRVEPGAKTVPIGRGIANSTTFVLDPRMELVPPGVPGELYVGGDGLARCYCERPELTASRFVPNPFSRSPGARLYRTGDRVRFTSEGVVEFLGRFDDQVKIHGFRIEPGEVETVLMEHEGVESAVVFAREDAPGDKKLVAYVTGRAEAGNLRAFLEPRLPAYMLPSTVVVLDSLPLNANGKVDRSALGAIEPAAPSARRGLEAPRTEVEQQIAAVWRELLACDDVGLHDNFFDLGGHSLLIVRMHSRLEDLFAHAELSVTDLFRYPTVHGLATRVSAREIDRKRPELNRKGGPASGKIAILAMSGRFPEADSPDDLFRNLCEGRESIAFFSAEEAESFDGRRAPAGEAGFVGASGVLEGVELFDAEFFGYNPREAAAIDPQQRVFLECAWEALELAGYGSGSDARAGGAVGVFAGTSANSYLKYLLADGGSALPGLVGTDKDFLPTRVSYKLDLKGPSVNVQTACSTSLVALHLACQSLLGGECDMALAGGVSIRLPQKSGYLYEPEGITSPDGRCRAFDARAEGTVGGNGAGVVVLKRLEDALADGDTVVAVVAGSAINNDGADKVGYTAPSVGGQAAVIRAAQARAGVDSSTVGYVECHGTGTALGDPIEISALKEAFGPGAGPGTCALASLKPSIGHLDAAAGIASLIKTALVLKHGKIPKSLHFERLSPEIDLEGSPFFVNAELREWERNGGPRRAGVSSFGIGGTNAHVVLEEAPGAAVRKSSEPGSREEEEEEALVVLSARTARGLEMVSQRLDAHFERHPETPLADAAFTLQVGRRRFRHRRVLVARSVEDLRDQLRGDGGTMTVDDRRDRDVVFVISGQGSQYVGMGGELYRRSPAFRRAFDALSEPLERELGLDPKTMLLVEDGVSEEQSRRLRQTAVAQPLLFALELALARTWMAWGITPRALLGHSLGEYVAACLASVFTAEEGVRLTAARGRLMQALPPGAMLGVALSEEDVVPFLSDDLSLAAVNAPELTVASGSVPAVRELERELDVRGIAWTKLHTSHAFHSSMMDPVLEAFTRVVAGIELQTPRVPFVSNVSGTWIRDDEATDPAYWARHLRSTVRFHEGVRTIAEAAPVVIEVGPGSTLSRLLRQEPSARSLEVVPTLADAGAGAGAGAGASESESESESESNSVRDAGWALLLRSLGRLWLAGVRLDWERFHEGAHRHRVPLPSYPFERKRYWVDPKRTSAAAHAPLQKIRDVGRWTYVPSWRRSTPPSVQATSPLDGSWLLLAAPSPGEDGLGELLRERLEEHGAVVKAVSFGATESTEAAAEAADAAIAAIARNASRGEGPLHIVHLGGASASPRSSPSDPSVESGFMSLVHLCRSLVERLPERDVTLSLVTSEVQEVLASDGLSPEKSAVAALLKVIPQEHPQIRCRNIDIDVDVGLEAPDAGREALVAALAREVLAGAVEPKPEPVVALRSGQRWVQHFEPLPLIAPPNGSGASGNDRGVYLVTGGLGHVGLALSRHLARARNARLVLVGRSAPSDAAASALEELGALGGEALYRQADVADEAEMRAIVADAESRWGAVRGVVHAAGVTGGASFKPVRELGPEELRAQLRPKAKGVEVLAGILEGRKLDFVLLTSSLSCYLGGPGYGAYAAANQFLDSFAHERRRRGEPWWVSVSFDGWMRESSEGIGPSPLSMTAEEGASVFERIVSTMPGSPVLVSTGDLEARLETWVRGLIARSPEAAAVAEDDASPAEHARPELIETEFRPPTTDLERSIVDLWRSLLGYDRVGVDDDFFELGGHSLLATKMVARLRTLHHVEISLRSLFETRTPRRLAEIVGALTRTNGGTVPARGTTAVGSSLATAPLSFAQHRIWFLDRLEPGTSSYNWFQSIRLRGALVAEALETSLSEIVRRHEILRTTFEMKDGEPVQRVHPEASFALVRDGVMEWPEEAREAEARRRVLEMVRSPFDLERGPLVRAGLLKLGENDHVLTLAMHHIVTDGWSSRVLMSELVTLYRAALAGSSAVLPDLRLSYRDYALSQRERLERGELDPDLDYWRRKLKGAPAALALPTDHPRPVRARHRGGRVDLAIPDSLVRSLRSLSRREGTTIFMTLLAAFKLLLSRYTGETDVVVGTPIANRTREELEGLIGFFLNTLVLRTELSGAASFLDLLARERDVCLEAYAHQELPFEKLLEEVQPERSFSRSPLFQVFFNMLNLDTGRLELPGLEASLFSTEVEHANFDLTLYVAERGDELLTVASYDADLFEAETVERMLSHYRLLLEQIARAPEAPLESYGLLPPPDRARLDDPSRAFDSVELETVVSAFERVANALPEAVALRQSGRTHSYGALSKASERIASRLLELGARGGDVVAVAGAPSFGWIAAILGALRSGASILTLDGRLPEERRRLVLEEAKVTRIVYAGEVGAEDRWLEDSDSVIAVPSDESPFTPDVKGGATPAALPPPVLEAPAYVFFTSGTTGAPKAVFGTHAGLSHFVSWQRERFAVGPEDRVAQLTSPSFDAILRDLFLPLTSGASLVLPDPGMDLGADGVVSFFAREAVTVVHTVPTLAETWLSDAPSGPSVPSLRWTFFSGEPLRAELVRRWRERFSGNVVNLYGPTETTMTKCFYVVPEHLEEGDFVVPLGEAMPGAQVLVVGAGGRRCGIGELGEIVIRTPYRTIATPGRPNEAASGFERNPSVEDPDDLLYFTGDLGRYRSDGTISYLGRRDGQLKVRGARVEPSEIETLLDQHPDVVQSAVVGLRHGSEPRLGAHVVRRPGSELTADALKAFLRGKLPEYMVPWIVAWNDALPRTASGKLDRRALAERPLELQRSESSAARTPRTPVEKELLAIWRELLSLDDVGIDEDFFDLGGHSLLVTRLLSRVRAAFGAELPLRTVFERPTIEGLALALTEALAESEDEAEMLRFIAELKSAELVEKMPDPGVDRGSASPGVVDDWVKET